MAKYKNYDYSQDLLIPVCLQEQLMPGTLEFAIHHLAEERVDTSIFDDRYRNDETGRSAYDPKVLLKVILFAYSRGLVHLNLGNLVLWARSELNGFAGKDSELFWSTGVLEYWSVGKS